MLPASASGRRKQRETEQRERELAFSLLAKSSGSGQGKDKGQSPRTVEHHDETKESQAVEVQPLRLPSAPHSCPHLV